MINRFNKLNHHHLNTGARPRLERSDHMIDFFSPWRWCDDVEFSIAAAIVVNILER